ncbi:MAG: hypothetical protein ACRESZ_09180 [Methylococcales bacterium]
MADGIDLPEKITRREDRLQALGEAKVKIAARVKERDEQAQNEYESAGKCNLQPVKNQGSGTTAPKPVPGPRTKST